MRGAYDDVVAKGVDIVAIGTGDVRYAQSFIRDESIPFRVFVDDDAAAARVASVTKSGPVSLIAPRTWASSRQAWRDGFRIHKSGKRVTQLGATFVIGPGPALYYEHLDAHSSDHAPVEDVVAAIPSRPD